MPSESGRWFLPVFVIVAIVFFLGTLVLPLASRTLFISPDETASAFFARQVSETGSFQVADPLTAQFNDTLYPRSVVAIDGKLVPQSFVGLPVIYGVFVYFFGPFVLFILTPLLTILAALALRTSLRSLFSPFVADLSSLLFLLHPAMWYYSARGLMHNVLFVCLLIFGVYFFVRRPLFHHLERCKHRVGKLIPIQKHLDPLVSGVFIGLSIFVRASEVYWVLGAAFFLLFCHPKRPKPIEGALLFLMGALLGVLPFFLFNFFTYGHPLTTGYTVTESVDVTRSAIASITTANILFPFGLDLKTAISHIADYGLLLFWWFSALALIGFGITLPQHRFYTTLFFLVSLWLGIWYGSWTFFDNPDPTQITIANSHVRYWLPVFILSIPFVAEALVWISSRARTRLAHGIALTSLMLFVGGMSVRVVFFDGQDALFRVARILKQSAYVKEDVLSRTESDAVIIVDRADKLFFPDRHVRYPLRSEETYALMSELITAVPLYYYGITLPEKDTHYLNESKLKSLGLRIEYLNTYEAESLYQLWPSD